jgi:hypothetical protein
VPPDFLRISRLSEINPNQTISMSRYSI